MKPTLIMVGADKGGVGKTTVARALLDYFASNNVIARAFDTEFPRGTLHRFHPEITEVVDITQTPDQMRILDTLNTSQVKVSVIDTRAGALTTSLEALREVGFLDAARAGDFNFMLFHVLGPSIASLGEIAETTPFVSDAHYFLVKNYINDATFFDWDPTTAQTYFGKARNASEVVIPKLNAMAYEQVDLAGTPWSTFVANRTAAGEPAQHSFTLRGYVRTWQNRNAEEFKRIRLLDFVNGRI
ncbi:MAG TPA: hypothetical protein VKV77_13935 [Methylovirgula sp.]|nr:hypothetical protein [Methylovirgula sp.]